jgi:hypothetical protein
MQAPWQEIQAASNAVRKKLEAFQREYCIKKQQTFQFKTEANNVS